VTRSRLIGKSDVLRLTEARSEIKALPAANRFPPASFKCAADITALAQCGVRLHGLQPVVRDRHHRGLAAG
jgi:hypothetical protein